MLTKLRLKNFKCFEKLEVTLNKVNILTGINGMGKSTIIQSLLLLRQSYMEDELKSGLRLNGNYVKLGNGQDILSEKATEEKIEIMVGNNGTDYSFVFDYLAEEDIQPVANMTFVSGNKMDIFEEDFVYLSAYRIEPKDLYKITNEQMVINREFDNSGEYAFQYLKMFGNDDIKNKNVIVDNKLGNSLANQVKVWMDMISPGVSPQIDINMKLRTSEVRYEYIEGRNKTNSYKSVNVGFGITYVLPILITLLSAKENDIILLENPEAHIHPAGQRKLGELIAAVGAGNIQVIVETHSDHILNGIRIAVKQGKLSAQDANLLYFYKDEGDDYKHKVTSPVLYNDGRISEWPVGFFDEWDNALLELL